METENNVIVKYVLNGKVLTPEEIEQNKTHFAIDCFNSKVKTDAILGLRNKVPAGKNAILYIHQDLKFTTEFY